MGLIRVLKAGHAKLRAMPFTTPELQDREPDERPQSGIALFMVIAAVSILSILVTEFTYIAQINQKLAYDGQDQLKAHYLAKSGLKISLLRLKAYQAVKQYASGMAKAMGGSDSLVPKSMIDKVWSFPFFYPFPTNIPGMSPEDKEKIKLFEKASGLDGKFSANIESESGKYNLNMLLAGFVAPAPSASPSAAPAPGASGVPPSPAPSPTEFNPQAAQDALKDYFNQLLTPKMEADPEFADQYRDPHLIDDLVDNIAAWVDRKHERRTHAGDLPMKGAPFYSLSELHMIPGMDDDLYNLFAPNLTVTRTPGINVNTIKEPALRALFPNLLKEEVTDFFKLRDSEDQDGSFKSEDALFKYVKEHFSVYEKGDLLDKRRKEFTEHNIRFVTDESEFKITVQASVNQSTRLIEAWVTLNPPGPKAPVPGAPSTPGQPKPNPVPNGGNPLTANGEPAPPDPGLKIHFMRVL